MLGQRENSAPYIYIQEDPLKAEAIRVCFDSETEFNKWLEVVQQGRKTDKELIEMMKQKQNESIVGPPRQKTEVQRTQSGVLSTGSSNTAANRAQTQRLVEEGSPSKSSKKMQDTSFSLNQPNVFNIATKVKDSFEIGQIIKELVEGKFKVKSGQWHLRDSYDGINVYSDSVDASLKST